MALPTPDLLPLFNALPGANLLLAPDLRIVGASDDYLASSLTQRDALIGQFLFDAFPENPEAAVANGEANVRASLAQVLATGRPHEMPPQHYDIPDPAQPGHFVERHWLPRHIPVLDAHGQVQFLIQSVQDITESRMVEQQLRDSHARERQARAEAEAGHRRLHDILTQLPAQVAVNRGPDHVYELVNPRYQQQFPVRTLLGRPVREALPELEGQQFFELLDQVYQTGKPFYGQEMPAEVDYTGSGRMELRYFNVFFQALRDAQGRVDGLLNFAYDVTPQVLARREAEQLSQELEVRVEERTREALALQADLLAAAQQQADQRAVLYQVFEQTPAPVALLRGPGHRFEYVNPAYQAFFPGGPLAGREVADVAPELVAQGFGAQLDRVYRTGETFSGVELPFSPVPVNGEAPRTRYFTFTYQAYREHDRTVGVSIFAYDVTEQVEARREREAEREQLHELFLQAPAPIVILDGPALVFQLINPAYQRIFPGRDLLNKPLLEALPELVGTPIPDLFAGVYQTGEPVTQHELPLRMARHEGQEPEDIYWTFTYQARRDAHGAIDGVRVFAHDVTDQVRARRVVEASEQQVRELVENAPFLMGVYVGPELRFHLANQALLDGLGKGPDVLGQRYADVMPELKNHVVIEQMHQVLATGHPLHLRDQRLEVVMHGTPQTFYYNYSFIPLRDAEGQVYGVLNTAADVTDLILARQRLESYAAELQESEARFRTMADAAPNLVWAVHPDASLRYVNRAFLDFLGLPTVEAFAAIGWGPYIHPEDLNQTQQTLGQAMAERGPYALEHRMRGHDGQYRWLLSQGAPSYLAGGELYGYVGASLDITDLKQANEQLTRTNVDLDNFIYTASHDLKAPITNIEGLLDTLRHELPTQPPTGEVAYILDLMQGAVERFQRTIEHLTAVSKLQKEHNPPTAQVALAPVLEDVRQDLAPLLQQTGGRLHLDVAACPPLKFAEKNLRSVLYNLLNNALKYRHPDRVPEVHVRCRQEAGCTVLDVQDNGLGLDVAREKQVFAMFQRLHSHVEGSGLGLYMVKRMVENAGGKITVHSQVGEGTTFTVHFPC